MSEKETQASVVRHPDAAHAAPSSLEAELGRLIQRFAGPLADEVGELFALPVRYMRLTAATAIAKRAEKRLVEKGISFSPVALRTLFRIIEAGSLETDEGLTEKWVGLLASAAAGDLRLSSYPRILEQLIPLQARLLDFIADNGSAAVFDCSDRQDIRIASPKEGLELPWSKPLQRERFSLVCGDLVRLALVGHDIPPETLSMERLYLTTLGHDFVIACRGP